MEDSELIEVMLEEYRALRAEILQASSNGNKILSFGVAAGGVLFSATSASNAANFQYFIPAVLLPMLLIVVLFMWMAERERMARCSHYLARLECRVAKLSGFAELLRWERWLRGYPVASDPPCEPVEKDRHFWTLEYSAAATLGLLSVAFPVFSFMVPSPLTTGQTCLVSTSFVILPLGSMIYLLVRKLPRIQGFLRTVAEP